MTSERWRLQIDYSKTVLEVYLDAVMALYEELFDVIDPACHYTVESQEGIINQQYCTSLFTLAGAMGLPTHQLNGLLPFLENLQETFLRTTLRNIRFTYTGRISYMERGDAIAEAEAPDNQPAMVTDEDMQDEIIVRWDSVTATRRNPLMRDVIPGMGLLLDYACTGLAPTRDCWYFQHGDYQYEFPCPPTSHTHELRRH
jgi:hypothetical protein